MRDYDEAMAWYRDNLGFVVREDADLGGGKRWVTVEPGDREGARLLLARADVQTDPPSRCDLGLA